MYHLDSFHDLRAALLGNLGKTRFSVDEIRKLSARQRGSADHLSLYGLKLDQLSDFNIKLLGRTILECASDRECDAVMHALANNVAVNTSGTDILTLELFGGSANLSFHIASLTGATCYVAEIDTDIFTATRHNLEQLNSPVTIINTSYRDLVAQITPRNSRDLYIIDPPWGDAFCGSELDFRHTSPPVVDIVDEITQHRSGSPFLILVKGNDVVVQRSVDDILARGDLLDRIELAYGPEGMNVIYWLAAIHEG